MLIYIFLLFDEGELDGVKENLPELLSKYPNDPGVLFLKAVLTEDGESALEQYKYVLKKLSQNHICSKCCYEDRRIFLC